MKLWQGLGYYSRARNLHETAKNIHQNFKGKFPDTFDELKKLKGVGEYTASAIASFAFGETKAVVDGNVIRVLSRIFGIETAFDTTEGKKQFGLLAQELIDAKNPGTYNQAIMDFGATVCLPQNPQCDQCPFRKKCVANTEERIEELPNRQKKPKITNRYFNYLVIKNKKEIFIRKRTGNDIWKNLYELPMIETQKSVSRNFEKVISKFISTDDFTIQFLSKEITQMLSHRKIYFRFIHVEAPNFSSLRMPNTKQVKLKSLSQFAFPKIIHLYLFEKSLL